MYSDPNGIYGTTQSTIKIPIQRIATKIEITVAPENTVNKTATIFVVLKDDNDNTAPKQNITITLGNKIEEVNLKNGFVIYTYTPLNIANDTISIKYLGNELYLPSTNNTTITVTPNKDEIIENLKQEINNQNNTINNLTNLTKTQNNTINTQTKQINDQNNTINTQTKQINDANNKLASVEQQSTATIKTVKATKTVKKSKKFTITVKLNKAVKGKKVFVIFNGKTYSAKTNAKGISKITIKKSALKKLGGKKVKYQVISGEKAVKRSIKVKK